MKAQNYAIFEISSQAQIYIVSHVSRRSDIEPILNLCCKKENRDGKEKTKASSYRKTQ